MHRLLFAAMIAVLGLGMLPGTESAVARAQISPDWVQPGIAPGTVPDEIPGVDLVETFDSPVPMDATFVDHRGRAVTLGSLFDGERPVVLMFVYHQCASFCDMVLRAMTESLAMQPWTVGVEFDVITISIDPRDTPAVLTDARTRALGRYPRSDAATGWHFLSGTDAQIRRVTDAVGYQFVWDARTEQFGHPGAVMVLQPNGTVARYLYGLELPHNDLRLALIDADEGRHVASLIEQAVLSCYRWDHSDGTYVIAARRLMRLGGLLTMAIVGGFLIMFWRRERRRDSANQDSANQGGAELATKASESSAQVDRARES